MQSNQRFTLFGLVILLILPMTVTGLAFYSLSTTPLADLAVTPVANMEQTQEPRDVLADGPQQTTPLAWEPRGRPRDSASGSGELSIIREDVPTLPVVGNALASEGRLPVTPSHASPTSSPPSTPAHAAPPVDVTAFPTLSSTPAPNGHTNVLPADLPLGTKHVYLVGRIDLHVVHVLAGLHPVLYYLRQVLQVELSKTHVHGLVQSVEGSKQCDGKGRYAGRGNERIDRYLGSHGITSLEGSL